MKETVLTGKRRSTTIAATPDDGKSQRKRRRRDLLQWFLYRGPYNPQMVCEVKTARQNFNLKCIVLI